MHATSVRSGAAVLLEAVVVVGDTVVHLQLHLTYTLYEVGTAVHKSMMFCQVHILTIHICLTSPCQPALSACTHKATVSSLEASQVQIHEVLSSQLDTLDAGCHCWQHLKHACMNAKVLLHKGLERLQPSRRRRPYDAFSAAPGTD